MNIQGYEIDQKIYLVSDENGKLKKRENIEGIEDILQIENDLDTIDEKTIEINKSIKECLTRCKTCKRLMKKSILIYALSVIIIGGLSIGLLSTGLIFLPILIGVNSLLYAYKRTQLKEINGLNSKISTLKIRKMDLNNKLFSLKSKKKAKEFDNAKEKRIAEFEKIRKSLKEEIDSELELSYDNGYAKNIEKPKILSFFRK